MSAVPGGSRIPFEFHRAAVEPRDRRAVQKKLDTRDAGFVGGVDRDRYGADGVGWSVQPNLRRSHVVRDDDYTPRGDDPAVTQESLGLHGVSSVLRATRVPSGHAAQFAARLRLLAVDGDVDANHVAAARAADHFHRAGGR
jgi:hypothetical protein